MRVDHREPELENHDRGLDWDLPRLLHRRGMLKLVAGAGLAGAGLVTLGACADASSTSSTSATPGLGRRTRPARRAAARAAARPAAAARPGEHADQRHRQR